MDMPASPPRPAPAAVPVPVVGKTAAARTGRRRWRWSRPQASLGLARLGGALLAWSLLLALAGGAAEAQQRGFQAPPQRGSGPLEVDITQGTLKPIPIAIPEFAGEDARFAVELSNVVAADLERSGLFQPLNRESFIQRLADHNATPRFSDWRAINAQALVVGRAGRAGDGRLAAEFRLWDVLSGRQLAGQRLAVGSGEWRRLAHLIADQIYERLTGEKGYFDTQIVFI
jgi:TolB protein